MDEVIAQVKQTLDTGVEAKGRSPQERARVLAQCLHRSCRPTRLLASERVYEGRNLTRGSDVRNHLALPSGQLGPIGKIQIFAHGVIVPAAAPLDARPAPKARAPVEGEGPAQGLTPHLLHGKVTVQGQGLGQGNG